MKRFLWAAGTLALFGAAAYGIYTVALATFFGARREDDNPVFWAAVVLIGVMAGIAALLGYRLWLRRRGVTAS